MQQNLEDLYNECFGYVKNFSFFKDMITIKDNDIIIGAIGIEKDYDEITLLTGLCVSAKYRNRGVATQILEICANMYKNKPLVLYINKNEDKDKLEAFYNKRGFISYYSNDTLPIDIKFNPETEILLYKENK